MEIPCKITPHATQKQHHGVLTIDFDLQEIRIKAGSMEAESLYFRQFFERIPSSQLLAGIQLTGADEEITDFSLEFEIQIPIRQAPSSPKSPTPLHIFIAYSGSEEKFSLTLSHFGISSTGNGMETAFINLNQTCIKSGIYLHSCANCQLSGYEKGGSTLFCFLPDKEKMEKNPAAFTYQNHFGNLARMDTLEFHHCPEYRPSI